MTKRPLRDDEIEVLIDYFRDYMIAVIDDRGSERIETAIDVINARKVLKEYLKELQDV